MNLSCILVFILNKIVKFIIIYSKRSGSLALGKHDYNFFLIGVYESSKQAIQAAETINDLFTKDLEKISHLGRARFSCEQTFEYMKLLPQVTVSLLSKELKITAPTARSALNQLNSMGILEEVSGKKRDKVYIYRKYLNILEDGAEPISEGRL